MRMAQPTKPQKVSVVHKDKTNGTINTGAMKIMWIWSMKNPLKHGEWKVCPTFLRSHLTRNIQVRNQTLLAYS